MSDYLSLQAARDRFMKSLQIDRDAEQETQTSQEAAPEKDIPTPQYDTRSMYRYSQRYPDTIGGPYRPPIPTQQFNYGPYQSPQIPVPGNYSSSNLLNMGIPPMQPGYSYFNTVPYPIPPYQDFNSKYKVFSQQPMVLLSAIEVDGEPSLVYRCIEEGSGIRLADMWWNKVETECEFTVGKTYIGFVTSCITEGTMNIRRVTELRELSEKEEKSNLLKFVMHMSNRFADSTLVMADSIKYQSNENWNYINICERAYEKNIAEADFKNDFKHNRINPMDLFVFNMITLEEIEEWSTGVSEYESRMPIMKKHIDKFLDVEAIANGDYAGLGSSKYLYTTIVYCNIVSHGIDTMNLSSSANVNNFIITHLMQFYNISMDILNDYDKFWDTIEIKSKSMYTFGKFG